jgi:deoxyribonuclease V
MRISIPTAITPQKAIKLQQRLAPLVKQTSDPAETIKTIVGCDACYLGKRTIAAAVSLSYDNLVIRRTKVISGRTAFPYIPGLLAYREGPAVIRAIRTLRPSSYVCIVDGHGVAHPRNFGLACFVGLVLGRPTIGVAKSLLCGTVSDDRVVDEQGHIIAELITLPRSGKTIYVSVGHKISLTDAVGIVKRCLTPQGPLPIRLAHEEVTRRKWHIERSSQAFS